MHNKHKKSRKKGRRGENRPTVSIIFYVSWKASKHLGKWYTDICSLLGLYYSWVVVCSSTTTKCLPRLSFLCSTPGIICCRGGKLYTSTILEAAYMVLHIKPWLTKKTLVYFCATYKLLKLLGTIFTTSKNICCTTYISRGLSLE